MLRPIWICTRFSSETRRCQRGRDQDVDLNREVRGRSVQARTYSPSFSPENVPAFLEAVKKREKTLSGFGHRQVQVSMSFPQDLTQPSECTRQCVQGTLISLLRLLISAIDPSLIQDHLSSARQRMRCSKCEESVFPLSGETNHHA